MFCAAVCYCFIYYRNVFNSRALIIRFNIPNVVHTVYNKIGKRMYKRMHQSSTNICPGIKHSCVCGENFRHYGNNWLLKYLAITISMAVPAPNFSSAFTMTKSELLILLESFLQSAKNRSRLYHRHSAIKIQHQKFF